MPEEDLELLLRFAYDVLDQLVPHEIEEYGYTKNEAVRLRELMRLHFSSGYRED